MRLLSGAAGKDIVDLSGDLVAWTQPGTTSESTRETRGVLFQFESRRTKREDLENSHRWGGEVFDKVFRRRLSRFLKRVPDPVVGSRSCEVIRKACSILLLSCDDLVKNGGRVAEDGGV